MKNVFVIGLDPFNRHFLETLPEAQDIRFHDLLEFDEVRGRSDYPVEALLTLCEERLARFEGSIDAFLGFLDFPVTLMVALLRQRYGTPGPSFEAVLRCEHKLWSRLLQKEVVPDNIPYFSGFDPYDTRSFAGVDLLPPFWVKPIKSFRSYLAFLIRDEASFAVAMHDMQQNLARLSKPFDQLLDGVALPAELAEHREWLCIAESQLSGSQCTAEGYVYNGEVTVYGIVDSVHETDSSSFHRYEYPSRLPCSVRRRIAEICARVMPRLEYDNGPFNAEFFYSQTENRLWLLEINPRNSQSHAYLFERLHGQAHHQIALQLALGQRPSFAPLDKSRGVAAKFMIRARRDAFITGVPSATERAALIDRFGDAYLDVLVRPGQRLSDLATQDSYTYELADLYLSAADRQALDEAYRTALSGLTFRIAVEREMMLVV